MPYLAHFGLQDHPFSLTPNVDYYYPTQENTNIIASLEFALRRESGIVKIVGEVGTGKTLLCRLLINKLIKTEAVAYINAPQADAQSIILTVCEEFGVSPAGDISPYAALNRFLVEEHAKGRLAVVVIDEAQHLGKSGLEAIRLISNLETERSKLLQVVMFGQTELDELLRDPALRQLNQRVVFSFSTKPLTEAETQRYVAHRLKVSRRQGGHADIFNEDALTAIARRSGGIPRVVNIIADKSMLVAFSEGSHTVQRAHVLEAIRDSSGLVAGAGFDWTWLRAFLGLFGRRAVAVSLLAVLAAGIGGWFAWSATHRIADRAEPATVSATPLPAAVPSPAQSPAQPQSSPPSVMSPPASAAAAVPPPLPAATVPAVTPIAADAGGGASIGGASISPAPEAASPSMATATTKTHQDKPKRGAPRKTKSVPAAASGDEPPPAVAEPTAPVTASQPSEDGTQSSRIATSSGAAAPAAASTTGTPTSAATAPTAPVAAPAAAPVDIPVTNDAAINATLPGRPGIYGSGRGH